MKRLCLALSLLLPTLALAQKAPAPEPASDFGEMIDVRVVNVEAVVTDRQGNRVPDLQAGDFRLQVDGKEVPVSFFTEVRDGKTADLAAEPAAKAPGGSTGTSYLLFIDDYFSTAVQRNQVLAALRKDLPRLRPDDRMAVVSFDGARLALLTSWTGAAESLGRAFDAATARNARGLDRITELRSFLLSEDLSDHVIDNGGHDPIQERVLSDSLSVSERAFGITLVRQIDAVVSAAVSAMRGSGAPAGRKVLLLLSGGWPYSVQSYLRGAKAASPSHDLPDGEQLFRPLASTANLLGFTIYPVDVPGIGSSAADAAETRQPGDPLREKGALALGGLQSGAGLREQEVDGTLLFLAQETGGKALLNSLRLAALSATAQDLQSYYWLGFTPTWEHNDRRHEIALTVRRPGLKVRSRRSFLDLSPRTELAIRLESALLLGQLPDSVPMPLKLGELSRANTEIDIPVTLGLPVAAMTVLPVDGQYRAHLELRIAAADENGNRSDIPAIPLDLASTKPPKPNGYVHYSTHIKIRGNARHLVLATYDPLSGKIATAEKDLKP
jgi:VWFA-related protein